MAQKRRLSSEQLGHDENDKARIGTKRVANKEDHKAESCELRATVQGPHEAMVAATWINGKRAIRFFISYVIANMLS